MDILNLMLAIAEPKGMWESIIKWIQSGVGNYALTIIILTIGIKLIMLPIDFWQRYTGRVNAKQQAKLQPEMDKLKERYGNNQEILNQKTQELYKREGYNLGGTCFGMLIYMIVTTVVFFTLFAGINKMQYYKIDQEYLTLQKTYVETVVENYEGNTEELYDADGNFLFSTELSAEVQTKANQAVVDKYYDIRTNFLWIKNVWIPDSYKAVIPDYAEYLNITKQSKLSNSEDEANRKLAYNTVMEPLIKNYEGKWNGLLLLPVITIGVSVLSTYIPIWMEKSKCKKRGLPYKPQQQNKTMIFVMPVILGVFTLFYNSVFALYIVTGAIFGLFTTPLSTLLIDHIENKKLEKAKNAGAPTYSRRAPVDISNKQTKAKNNNKSNKNSSPKSITKAVGEENKKTTSTKNKNK